MKRVICEKVVSGECKKMDCSHVKEHEPFYLKMESLETGLCCDFSEKCWATGYIVHCVEVKNER